MANLKNTTINDTGFFKLPSGDTAARPASPAARQLRFNTDTGELEQFRPGLGAWIAPSNTGVIATGGDSVYDVDVEGTTYRVHVFTSTGTSAFSVLQGGEAEYLIVAGGGSGGNDNGGGGGAGGLLTGFTTVIPQAYTITVGSGGTIPSNNNSGNQGQNSSAFGLTAIGGGGGGGDQGAGNGGSGGGSPGERNQGPGSGTAGQGNDGGNFASRPTQGHGGGGGGAGSVGGDAGTGFGESGNGGQGQLITITGVPAFYAGGGAGAVTNSEGPTAPGFGIGGLGGGGNHGFGTVNAYEGEDGLPNTGGGGAGGAYDGSFNTPGAGGSGIVIIRYPLRQNNPETAAGQDVRNGLVLDLDFAKPTVYSGSGSVVTDGRLNGVEGNLINGPSFVDPRTHRSAFDFDGSNDYIQGTLTNPGGEWIHSITFWMNMNQDQSSISSRQDPFQIGNNASTSQYSALDISNNNINWYFYSNDTRVSSNLFNANVWYYIALTYAGGIANNTNKKFYVNGTNIPFDTSGSATLNIAQNANFTLGRDNQRTTAHFNGKIAVFKVYNRSLSSDEVQSIYNATRWRFGV